MYRRKGVFRSPAACCQYGNLAVTALRLCATVGEMAISRFSKKSAILENFIGAVQPGNPGNRCVFLKAAFPKKHGKTSQSFQTAMGRSVRDYICARGPVHRRLAREQVPSSRGRSPRIPQTCLRFQKVRSWQFLPAVCCAPKRKSYSYYAHQKISAKNLTRQRTTGGRDVPV